jgi:hypothetical protein
MNALCLLACYYNNKAGRRLLCKPVVECMNGARNGYIQAFSLPTGQTGPFRVMNATPPNKFKVCIIIAAHIPGPFHLVLPVQHSYRLPDPVVASLLLASAVLGLASRH